MHQQIVHCTVLFLYRVLPLYNRVDIYFVTVDINFHVISLQIVFIFIFLNAKVSLMVHAKFQPIIPSHFGEKVDFIGFAIGCHLGFSTRLNFTSLKPCSLIMQHVKFEIHG